MTTYRLDFGPEWSKGIVTKEPPGIGKPFIGRVPAVDEAGNDRAGIRLPEIAVPLATHTGWNYRRPTIGAPDRLASEIGSHAKDVNVEAVDGVVALRGTVPDEARHKLALDSLARLAHVSKVIDLLRVR